MVPYVQRDPDCSFLADSLLWGDQKIRRVESSSSGRYITILPVRDYGNMHQKGERSPLSLLTPEDRAAINSGRTMLLLDHTNEGPAFNPIIFDIFHNEVAAFGLRRDKIVFCGQNRRMGLDYRAHYGEGMKFWSYDYFPMAIAIWMDSVRGKQIFGADAFPIENYSPLGAAGTVPRFLSFNAAARWHRLLLYRWLQMQGMMAHGIVSFHGVNSGNPKSHEIDIKSPPPELLASFPELIEGIGEWMPAAPVRVGQGVGLGNDLIMTIDVASYELTLFSIVSESDFFEAGIERLTEKSLKVAAMGHPFVILGAPRTVSALAELGFCTFGGLINHAYDLVEDPVERMRMAFRSITQSWDRIRSDPDRWRADALQEAQFNFKHARGGLAARLGQLAAQPVVQRMERFVATGELLQCP